MKSILNLNWIVAAFLLIASEARAELVLNPTAGLSRVSIYGSMPGGPPMVDTEYYPDDPTAPVVLLDTVDHKSSTGFAYDDIQLYDMHGLTAASLLNAIIEFQVDSVYRNWSTDVPASASIYMKFVGKNVGTLDASDYASIPSAQVVFSIPAGNYDGSGIVDVNITSALVKLLNAGFDFTSILLQTVDNTTWGPSEVDLVQPPTLRITAKDISPGNQTVPEASSIVQLGGAIVGMILFQLRGRSRATR